MELTTQHFIALLPLLVTSATIIVVMLAIAWKRNHAMAFILSVLGLNLALLSLIPAVEVTPLQVTPLLLVDKFACYYMALVLAATLACTTLVHAYLGGESGKQGYPGNREELYLLTLLSGLGGLVLVSAQHLAGLFIGLELLSVPTYGMIAYASSLDQGGPIAQSAEDAALLLQVMAGFDPRDATSLDKEVPDYTSALNRPIAGLTIGLPKEFFDSSVDESVRYANHAALMEFEKLGARLTDISLPDSAAGIPCFYVIAPAEASSNLSRFDGVRYGYRTKSYRDLNEMYEKTRAEGFGLEVKRRIMIGTFALSAGYYDAYYRKAQQIRQIIADDFREAFRHCDYIAGPTSPTPAFALGEKTNDPVSMYLSDIFTITANLAGIPAISIPVGFDNTGLPIGLQLTGQSFDESGLLNLGHRYQQVTDWHRHLPKDFS